MCNVPKPTRTHMRAFSASTCSLSLKIFFFREGCLLPAADAVGNSIVRFVGAALLFRPQPIHAVSVRPAISQGRLLLNVVLRAPASTGMLSSV